ncbi:MAG: hypothetical protein ASARMPRED_000254 [Alectoria sarmentosa]|nr:MAG: hypothetical protein ASARMPRED_000254 [Alectoria sarmentosa]
MAHKRSNSSLDAHGSQPNKTARIETISAATDAFQSANARIVELEHQVQDLHAFIDANGLTRVAPQSIRQHMLTGPGAAKALADQIKVAASKVSDKLYDKTFNARKTGISSDDMSEAMMPFLDEIEGLRKLPDSTAIAFDLVMTLGEYSYGDMNSGAGYGERPSDQDVDELLVELATERKNIDPFWNFLPVLETLKERAENLADYGIEDFCAQTIDLLSAWQRNPPANKKLTQEQ